MAIHQMVMFDPLVSYDCPAQWLWLRYTLVRIDPRFLSGSPFLMRMLDPKNLKLLKV